MKKCKVLLTPKVRNVLDFLNYDDPKSLDGPQKVGKEDHRKSLDPRKGKRRKGYFLWLRKGHWWWGRRGQRGWCSQTSSGGWKDCSSVDYPPSEDAMRWRVGDGKKRSLRDSLRFEAS